jgi:lipopolysaccharide/colanic/teichoic acid biosynthesis glycosyltransferase
VNGTIPLPEASAQRKLQFAVKRAMDIVISAIALVGLAPVFALLAMAIKADSPGPVMFRQWRTGRGGKTFLIYKFRSLYADASDNAGIRQADRGDSRVTPIGRLLRAKSLDELPQLINVLRGEMSLIGPRPLPPGMLAGGVLYDQLVPYFHLRHAVRPGISGWAQANGLRGPTTDTRLARDRIDHDLAYIQNFSLWLDIKIIVLTLKREFLTGSGF